MIVILLEKLKRKFSNIGFYNNNTIGIIAILKKKKNPQTKN